MTTLTPALEISDLFVSYGEDRILNGINLIVDEGEVCCVLGEEGVGKSTLVKAITQQIGYKGMIKAFGIDLMDVPTHRLLDKRVDFVAQGGNVLDSFTVEEHLKLAMRNSNARVSFEDTLQQIEMFFPKIPKLKSQVAGRLSGGERMMLSLACIMFTDTQLIVLDEPTAGLSPKACKMIKKFLLSMQGKSILIIEHNFDFALDISSRQTILKEGELINVIYESSISTDLFIREHIYDFKN